ncbi:hypothetical protein SRABI106_04482 [Rahnella aquatilis]|nr:hypothetical protein SRABI106_04482 [Rahnella aquatilis]
MTRQCGVVGLDIHFDLFFQAKLFQEAIDGSNIIIILMLGRFLRFRFDQQGALEANFVFVLNDHLHEATQLFAFLTKISIEQGFVAFTAAPQHVIFSPQLFGGIHGVHNLRCGPGINFWIRIGRRACAVTWIGEAVSCTPQQFYTAGFLLLRQYISHDGKIIDVFFN